jgi:hypothetical protein
MHFCTYLAKLVTCVPQPKTLRKRREKKKKKKKVKEKVKQKNEFLRLSGGAVS